jgi:demethylmenaquinone methyltransferase/2-methoxy-6-polyprenyl-1,4-benzoquinol methylase
VSGATTTASLAESGADVRGMFNRIAKRYDATNRAMSVGIDVAWRKKAIARLIEGLGEAPRFLDLGAGTLDGALEIARRVPGARVAAADFAREMLVAGKPKLKAHADRVREGRLRRPELIAGGAGPCEGPDQIVAHAADGHDMPYRDGAFDGAFSAFCIRNLADLPRGMRELRRVVRPGGRVVLLEFLRPERPRLFIDRIWNAHVLPLVGRIVSGDRDAYRYLPESIGRFRSPAELAALLNEVGFADVETKALFPSGVATMVVAS